MKYKELLYEVNEQGCHICVSHGCNSEGYPWYRRDGKKVKICRHLYKKVYGEISENILLRHTCDNRLCINVDHLVPGTHEDNVNDRVIRNRSATGVRNGRAKLTDTDVVEIRRSITSARKAATKYNVDPSLILAIRRRKVWKHI